MGWQTPETVGEQLVYSIFHAVHPDPNYVMSNNMGFTLWTGDLATHVRTDEGIFRQNQSTYHVVAETELLRGHANLKELAVAIEHLMDDATLNSVVYVPDRDVFVLQCGIYADADQAEWMNKIMPGAVALQMAESYDLVDRLQEVARVFPAFTAHPQTGKREGRAPIVCNAHQQLASQPGETNPFIGSEDWRETSWTFERECNDNFNAEEAGVITAQMGWSSGDGNQEIVMSAHEPHKLLGAGLHATLTIPMPLNEAAIAHLVLDLNKHEYMDYKRCHRLGSWCEHDGKLAFRIFVPARLYAPGMLQEIGRNLCTRAAWTDEWFYALKQKAGSG